MAKLKNHITRRVRTAVDKTMSAHTAHLKASAMSAGWDPEIANSLGLRLEGIKYRITYPMAHHQQIMTYEYGTDEIPPSPVLRRFMSGIKDGTI